MAQLRHSSAWSRRYSPHHHRSTSSPCSFSLFSSAAVTTPPEFAALLASTDVVVSVSPSSPSPTDSPASPPATNSSSSGLPYALLGPGFDDAGLTCVTQMVRGPALSKASDWLGHPVYSSNLMRRVEARRDVPLPPSTRKCAEFALGVANISTQQGAAAARILTTRLRQGPNEEGPPNVIAFTDGDEFALRPLCSLFAGDLLSDGGKAASDMMCARTLPQSTAAQLRHIAVNRGVVLGASSRCIPDNNDSDIPNQLGLGVYALEGTRAGQVLMQGVLLDNNNKDTLSLGSKPPPPSSPAAVQLHSPLAPKPEGFRRCHLKSEHKDDHQSRTCAHVPTWEHETCAERVLLSACNFGLGPWSERLTKLANAATLEPPGAVVRVWKVDEKEEENDDDDDDDDDVPVMGGNKTTTITNCSWHFEVKAVLDLAPGDEILLDPITSQLSFDRTMPNALFDTLAHAVHRTPPYVWVASDEAELRRQDTVSNAAAHMTHSPCYSVRPTIDVLRSGRQAMPATVRELHDALKTCTVLWQRPGPTSAVVGGATSRGPVRRRGVLIDSDPEEDDRGGQAATAPPPQYPPSYNVSIDMVAPSVLIGDSFELRDLFGWKTPWPKDDEGEEEEEEEEENEEDKQVIEDEAKDKTLPPPPPPTTKENNIKEKEKKEKKKKKKGKKRKHSGMAAGVAASASGNHDNDGEQAGPVAVAGVEGQ